MKKLMFRGMVLSAILSVSASVYAETWGEYFKRKAAETGVAIGNATNYASTLAEEMNKSLVETKQSSADAAKASAEAEKKAKALEIKAGTELVIGYGTEKKAWLEAALSEFKKTEQGSKVNVVPVGIGSLEGMMAVAEGGKVKTQDGREVSLDVWSPASSIYQQTLMDLTGRKDIFVNLKGGVAPSLVQSPMVYIMRRRVKEAVDAFIKRINESQVPTTPFEQLSAGLVVSMKKFEAETKKPWLTLGLVEKTKEFNDAAKMGAFKFGFTDPLKSNSGFIFVNMLGFEIQSASGNYLDSLEGNIALNSDFAAQIQLLIDKNSAQSNGEMISSTGTMTEEFFKKQTLYHAVVSYEHLAIEQIKKNASSDIVVVYPQHNIMNDHPYYILNGVQDRSRINAAFALQAFLQKKEIQGKVIEYGFRPVSPEIDTDTAFAQYESAGVKTRIDDIAAESVFMSPPAADVIVGLIDLLKTL